MKFTHPMVSPPAPRISQISSSSSQICSLHSYNTLAYAKTQLITIARIKYHNIICTALPMLIARDVRSTISNCNEIPWKSSEDVQSKFSIACVMYFEVQNIRRLYYSVLSVRKSKLCLNLRQIQSSLQDIFEIYISSSKLENYRPCAHVKISWKIIYLIPIYKSPSIPR